MGPTTALFSSLRGTFRFSGRATRAEFWWSWVILWPIVQLILIWRTLMGAVFGAPHGIGPSVRHGIGPGTQYGSGPGVDWPTTAVATALTLPMIAVGTRRLADAGVWRWLFVGVFLFGIVAQVIYRIPVPDAQSLETLMVQFDDITVPASELGQFPYLRMLHDVMPWIGRPLAILCLLLALLPSRVEQPLYAATPGVIK